MEIVVRGRHIEVSDRFREHVSEKLTKIERYDGKCHRVDVEVSAEQNPRLADHAVRVELTCHGKGPVIRAEASADEKYAALDVAYGRLVERLRRAAERRGDHRRKGRAITERIHAASPPVGVEEMGGEEAGESAEEGPFLVREKTHRAPAMTLDQALYEMELVGHDFFLFHDADTDTPSVVYRRKGYDYGVLHLEVEESAAAGATAS